MGRGQCHSHGGDSMKMWRRSVQVAAKNQAAAGWLQSRAQSACKAHPQQVGRSSYTEAARVTSHDTPSDQMQRKGLRCALAASAPQRSVCCQLLELTCYVNNVYWNAVLKKGIEKTRGRRFG
jgi:hypothetical protein